jgi:PTH1 family peptidyl-tRNA hydrolase
MYLIAGLGNPDKKYEFTRHNAGFLFLDYFAAKHGIKINKVKFKGLCGEGTVAGERVVLLKPSTYMNLSGQSVLEAMSFYRLGEKDLIVVFDDISLKLGSLRIRERGSAGGHNGIKDIIRILGSDEFKRIKLGTDVPRDVRCPTIDFVLSKFTAAELKEFAKSVENGAEALRYIISGETAKAMNLYNGPVR